MDLILTQHFTRRWMQRVGNWPTPEAVRHYLAHSVCIQPCRDLMHPDGTPFRVLAIYWHPDLDLVIKVDTERKAVVTVMSRDNWDGDAEAADDRQAAAPSRTLLERIATIKQIFGLHRPGTMAARGKA